MKKKVKKLNRPGTLAAVAISSSTLEEFGYNLRDWQHEIRDKWRGPKDFARRIRTEPIRLENKFPQGDVADAYLEAYALWLGDKVGISRVDWARARKRQAQTPWFSGFKRASLLRDSPAHFIERNLFTVPDASFLDRKLAHSRQRKSTNLPRKVRNKNRLTQAQLAELLNVNLSTLRNWEQERNHPKGAALILLKLLDQNPELIDKVDLILSRGGLNARKNS